MVNNKLTVILTGVSSISTLFQPVGSSSSSSILRRCSRSSLSNSCKQTTSTRRLSRDNLSSLHDLDLWPIQTKTWNGTSTCDGGHLCQIILKPIHSCRSYGPDNFWWTDTSKCNNCVSLNTCGLDKMVWNLNLLTNMSHALWKGSSMHLENLSSHVSICSLHKLTWVENFAIYQFSVCQTTSLTHDSDKVSFLDP